MEIFECKKCGQCCKGYGGTFIDENDIKKITAYINENHDDFLSKYCQKSGNKYLITQGENGYCIFWNKLCTIHPVKPKMCKKWPYIESVLKDENNWKIMGNSCPGIMQNVSYNEIVKCIKEKLII